MTHSRYFTLLDGFRSRRIAVAGDFLLDQYVLGTTARVSREAPIVVVDYQDTIYHPGGAANAAQNVTALGGVARAVGVCGEDREGDALTTLLRERGVDTGGLLREKQAATSTKLRILAGEMNAQKQQVARVDRSHVVKLDEGLVERMLGALRGAVAESDALLLADYGLGVMAPVISEQAIALAATRGIPVVVDSRYRLASFRGATVAVPNEVEAMEAFGIRREDELTDRTTLTARLAAAGLASIIVTRGSQGMVVCDTRGTFESIGIVGGHQATDVTGAGDTVAATVALTLASGASLVEAARMATFAASVVVMKRGTATASPEEIRAAVSAEHTPERGSA